MKPLWLNLNEVDRAAFHTAIAFLDGRLEERATFDWALSLNTNETVKRLALLELITNAFRTQLKEPWKSAWYLIEESWDAPPINDSATRTIYDAQRRLKNGDTSGSLINLIVELVSPRLLVQPFSDIYLRYHDLPKKPKKAEDLFTVELTSGEPIDPNILGLDNLTDQHFLYSLAQAIDAAVDKGINIAKRIGRNNQHSLRHMGTLYRVYYVPASGNDDDPDRHNEGISPSVKLLHLVVTLLGNIDISGAIEFTRRWKMKNTPIHLRLWAALSQNPKITPINEVSDTLLTLDDEQFWEIQYYPEIAELRAKRFIELEVHDQSTLLTRIKKLPPKKQWPRGVDANLVAKDLLYFAIREMRRIEIAGMTLPKRDKTWLENKIIDFPELKETSKLDEGFSAPPKTTLVPHNPDNKYDRLSGEARLKSIETALSSTRSGWDDDPAARATNWIRQEGNPVKILTDFESIDDGGTSFPKTWNRFCWAHSEASGQVVEKEKSNKSEECERTLLLLSKLPTITVTLAIEGISSWLSGWQDLIIDSPNILKVWTKLWPIAVETTNKQQPEEEEVNLNTVIQSNDNNSLNFDTLNTPTGNLVGIFLISCPNGQENKYIFEDKRNARVMRDMIMNATGRSALIAKHRMIEFLSYFLLADPIWTQNILIAPLIDNSAEALILWRAIARNTQFKDTLEIIGNPMVERAVDLRLDRKVRRSLVFSLVIECLHSFRERRDPVVPHARLQQMIRSLEDEIRAYAASAIKRFIIDLSKPNNEKNETPEQLFQSTATPFLQIVWPQEHSLATPGVSRELVKIPAIAHEKFTEAVSVIKPFLVPFECWSMSDYGLHGEIDGKPKLDRINNIEKASAFLQLLDLTIGTADGSVIPHDLPDALDQILNVSPKLRKNKIYRRLATLARKR